MMHPVPAACAVVALFLVSTTGCARQTIMARPGESALTAAPVPPPHALFIDQEIKSQCHLEARNGMVHAPSPAFDASLLASTELGTLEQLAACFTTGPMKGRTLTLTGRADPRGWREYAQSPGERRAEAVQGALVSFGLPFASVTTKLRGGTDPAGKDEPGWKTDRRVGIDVDPLR